METPEVYLIAGHGGSNSMSMMNGAKPVPRGCTIVVFEYEGKRVYSQKMIEHVTKFAVMDKKILQSPSTHEYELLQSFKNVAIYNEGDPCPNMLYSFLFIMDRYMLTVSIPSSLRDTALNGIIPYDTIQHEGIKEVTIDTTVFDLLSYNGMKTNFKRTMLLFFLKMFQYSIFPTVKQVIDDFIRVEEKKDTDSDLNLTRLISPTIRKVTYQQIYTLMYTQDNAEKRKVFMKLFIDKLKSRAIFYRSQNDLFSMLKPGVYYHFVCRANNVTDGMYEYMNGYNILKNSPMVSKSLMKKLFAHQAFEAHTRRRHTVGRVHHPKTRELRQLKLDLEIVEGSRKEFQEAFLTEKDPETKEEFLKKLIELDRESESILMQIQALQLRHYSPKRSYTKKMSTSGKRTHWNLTKKSPMKNHL
jgi:hypothetical protein